MPYTVVSFCTTGLYEAEMERLIKSCRAFDVAIDASTIRPMGSWAKNCAHKPEFIINMLDALDMPIVWLDADAEIVNRPAAFEDNIITEDMAAFRLFCPRPGVKVEVLSGTLMFRPNDPCRDLLTAWEKKCKADPETWDQKHLQQCMIEADGLSVHWLPESYCYIQEPCHTRLIDMEPVIVHHQFSRKAKRLMKGVV